ncbi:uncharacterized protein LOC126827485 isoform X2 [Patella vulgata]|uniref:uncharacterized protein LOC126827485 isoform X2 n=1 Tax=Patella vulgata TaxID=6465 RepID=UPI0024A86C3D|nr:uncharacterized protein LOC126827485 isoform X2 [Patella vulgata]
MKTISTVLSGVIIFMLCNMSLCKDVMTYYMETNCGKSLDLEFVQPVVIEAQPSTKSSGNLERICTVTLSLAKSSKTSEFSKICVRFDSLKISDKCDSALSLMGIASKQTNDAMYFLCDDSPPEKEVCSKGDTLVITITRGSQKASDVQFALKATNKFPESRSGWQEERWKDLEERQESSTIISIVCGAVVGAMFLVVMITVCVMYQKNQARARNSSTNQNGGDNATIPSAPPGTGVAYTAVPRNDTVTPLPGNHPVPEYHPMHVLPSHTPSEVSAPNMRIPGGFQQYAINSDAMSQRNYPASHQGTLGPQGQVPVGQFYPPAYDALYPGPNKVNFV